MSFIRSRWFFLTFIILVGCLLFCILVALSWSMFPGPFGPLDNNMSQLGNSSLNPNGAIFFNVALIIAGSFVVVFFIGVYGSYSRELSNTTLRVILICALIAGILNGISILMAGVYSEDYMDEHFFWALMVFITIVPILFLTNTALWMHRWFSKSLGIYGLLLGIFDAIFVLYVIVTGSPSSGAILEWVSVFGFMFWVVGLTFQMFRLQNTMASEQ